MKKSNTSQPLPGGGTMTTSIKDGQKTITINGGNNFSINPNTGQVSSHALPYNNQFFFHNKAFGSNSSNSGRSSWNVTSKKSGISIEKVTSLTLNKEQLNNILKRSDHKNYANSDDYLKASRSESMPKSSKP